MKKKGKDIVERHEHEMIIVLLVILTASVVSLAILVRAQGESLKDTQVLLQELAESRLDLE